MAPSRRQRSPAGTACKSIRPVRGASDNAVDKKRRAKPQQTEPVADAEHGRRGDNSNEALAYEDIPTFRHRTGGIDFSFVTTIEARLPSITSDGKSERQIGASAAVNDAHVASMRRVCDAEAHLR